MNRTEKAVKNISWGLFSKMLNLVLGFVSRTVFIRFLGNVLLGVNGLYTEILNMLSLAELGFGTALNFAMYKPVSNNDEDKIIRLLHFYRKIYRIIALVVSCIGILLLPFLHFIVKGAEGLSLFELRLFFVIFLINTVANYFITYKSSYINALQKNYVITKIETVVHLVTVCAQILVIILFKNYLVYLVTHTVLLLASKIIRSVYLDSKYPILRLREKKQLAKEEQKGIYKEVSSLFIHQFSSVAIHSTDNIIISSLSGLGVVAVGLVSNYSLLITSVVGCVTIVFSSLVSGFGNVVATSTKESFRTIFNDASFVSFWIYGFCSVAFLVLIPPFITLWLGEEFLIDDISFVLIVLNQYMLGQSSLYHNARVSTANFSKDKWVSLTQAVVNLVVSIIGAKYLGLVGVYIGTVVSRLILLIFRPIKTYRMMFDCGCKEYFVRSGIYFLATILSAAATYLLASLVLREVTVLTFIAAVAIVGIVPNAMYFAMFFKTREFKNVKTRVIKLVRRRG